MTAFASALIILMLCGSVGADPWPSAAVVDPAASTTIIQPNRLEFVAHSVMLDRGPWRDLRGRFTLALGLDNGLGIEIEGSSRDLTGNGAYQRGIEDTRLGIQYWPLHASHWTAGMKGSFLVPTGYRRQESYLDPETDSIATLPSFSLGKTAGEIGTGLGWSPSPPSELHVYTGYLSTSDYEQQAFRWAIGAKLTPFGQWLALDMGYGQSFTRAGDLPNTEVLSSGVAVKLWPGLTLSPGVWAELSEDPSYGASFELRVSAPIRHAARSSFGTPNLLAPARRVGAVLVPPPLADESLADREALWQCLQQELERTFDEVIPLASLDRPGLPFDPSHRERQVNSIRAIAESNVDARWLLIWIVEREEISRRQGLTIPLLFTRRHWMAECRIRLRWVDLLDLKTYPEQIVEVRAIHRSTPQLSVVTTPESDILNLSDSRRLAVEAYRLAGRQIARELPKAE